MNAELCKKALMKIGNPNILINMVSKRVRQLNSGGARSRPLVEDAANLGASDIVLREIIEDKLGYEEPVSPDALVEAAPHGRKRRKAST